jgi:hypothetical protein
METTRAELDRQPSTDADTAPPAKADDQSWLNKCGCDLRLVATIMIISPPAEGVKTYSEASRQF